MYRKSREDLIKEQKSLGLINKKCRDFYNLPHEEKADKQIFERFCEEENGYRALLLSDDEICDDKELVLIAKKNGFYSGYHLLSDRLLNDPEIAIALADCNRYEYTKINKSLRDDAKLMLEAVRINPSIYCSLPVKVKTDRNIVIEIAQKDPWELLQLEKVSNPSKDQILDDKEIALVLAKSHPDILFRLFSPKIISDKEILEEALCLSNYEEFRRRILDNTSLLRYVDVDYWCEDTKLIKKALKENGDLLEILPEKYKSKKEYVLPAVKSDPYVIKECSDEMRDDKDIVMAALQEDSNWILYYASDRLKDDYEVVFKAVKVDPCNLQYASEALRDNRDIVLRAVKNYGGVLEDASERLQQDDELRKIAAKNM